MRSREWVVGRRAKVLVGTVEDASPPGSRKAFTLEGDQIVTTCRRSNFFSDDQEFKSRDIEIVCRHGTKIWAIAKFREWEICYGVSVGGREFVMSADACSQADYECSAMTWITGGEYDHPLKSGEPLIIFDRLVIERPNQGIWPALTAAIDKAFKRRGGTMLLKAFPLEWEVPQMSSPSRTSPCSPAASQP